MPLLAAAPVYVSESQRQQLQALVRKQTSPQHRVKRASIILLADQGVGVHETMRRLGVSRTMVQWWRRRWREAEHGDALERLSDAPRCGAPARYTPEHVCAIVAIACERPADSDRPITHWTQQELADEARRRGIVEYVSQRSVGRFLKTSQPSTPPHPRLADRQAR